MQRGWAAPQGLYPQASPIPPDMTQKKEKLVELFLDLSPLCCELVLSYSSYLVTKHWHRIYWAAIIWFYPYWINNTFELFTFQCKRYTTSETRLHSESTVNQKSHSWEQVSEEEKMFILYPVTLAITNFCNSSLCSNNWDGIRCVIRKLLGGTYQTKYLGNTEKDLGLPP